MNKVLTPACLYYGKRSGNPVIQLQSKATQDIGSVCQSIYKNPLSDKREN